MERENRERLGYLWWGERAAFRTFSGNSVPQIHATFDKLRGAKYLTTLDLQQGYWQIPLSPESRAVTAFTVPGRGLMQFRVMPFGLHSAPATFQRLLDNILGPELEPHVFIYLDDIIIVSETFDEHLQYLAEVFLRNVRLRLNPEKCHFCRHELKYLGHIVDRRGIRTDPEKVRAMTQWPRPSNVRQIRQFVGLASWYRRFIPEFSATAAPLTRLTRKNARWQWGDEEEQAFQTLKKSFASAPVLACPDFSRRFVQTDASTTGLGVVLTQHFEDGERVIAYASRTLNGAEKNYSATELECLAVVWGIRHFRGYRGLRIEGYEFTVITDHQALRWLQKIESPTGRLGRWMLELQQYSFDVKYRRGRLNRVADALSRLSAIRATRGPRCAWYHPQLQRVRAQSDAHPEYTVKRGKLFRHVLQPTFARYRPTSGKNAYQKPSAPRLWADCTITLPRGIWALPERSHAPPRNIIGPGCSPTSRGTCVSARTVSPTRPPRSVRRAYYTRRPSKLRGNRCRSTWSAPCRAPSTGIPGCSSCRTVSPNGWNSVPCVVSQHPRSSDNCASV